MKKKTDEENEVIQNDRIIIDEFKNVRTVDANNVFVKIHTFKLESAAMLKNIGYDPKRPVLTSVEHCHFFHTYDSYGKKMTRTNFVGGHYHDVEVKVVNNEFVLVISPAMKVKGIDEMIKSDNHKHPYIYIRSEEIKAKQMSPDVAKYIQSVKANYAE